MSRLTDKQIAQLTTDRFYDAAKRAYVPTLAAKLAAEVQAYRSVAEVELKDAPPQYRGEEHHAWVAGYNVAIERLRAVQP